ncbi:hypothetical protein INT48_007170 [Thamnidium elegans]|uniref:Uncharacterized protein n=1 Tax=Thamnidium elegans TaxID=101142 RepID=A0A8H7SSF4_9FUNG|nr:hypothetical protein INT48_007170 [Thamnidium elegans]
MGYDQERDQEEAEIRQSSLEGSDLRIVREEQGQKAALLFDIHPARNDYDVHEAMVVLREQHPSAYACVRMKDGNRYLEVYPINVQEVWTLERSWSTLYKV